jgi:DNA polymerase-1
MGLQPVFACVHIGAQGHRVLHAAFHFLPQDAGSLFGRRRTLPELASTNFNVRASGERMARNTPIQGTAADVIKLAMVRVWKRLRDEKMASRLILTVHDELIVEAPEAEAEQAARILREEMEGCVQYAVPLSTDVHAGKNWLEAH